VTALSLLTNHRLADCLIERRSNLTELGDRAQNFAAVPQQNAEVLEVLLRQITEDREVNGVRGETLSVLFQADRCEPLGDTSHGTSQTDRREIANNGQPAALINLTLALPKTSRQVAGQT
jgi:hypothetical protein